MPAPLNDKHSDFPALEESRAGIRSFLLYYYETLLSLGYSVKDAKQLVAQLAKEAYDMIYDDEFKIFGVYQF